MALSTSVTAGTVMHGSKLKLVVWFWAAYLMATRFQRRRPPCDSEEARARLLQVGLLTFRPDGDRRNRYPAAHQGRSAGGGQGKLLIAGAVEVQDGRAGRLRLSALADFAVRSLHAFIKANIEAGATARINAWRGYQGAPGVAHDPHVVGRMAAHVVLPWTYRIFSNLKLWALGVYHGLRRNHLQCYLDEFVFRFNRRRNRHAAFRSLLGN